MIQALPYLSRPIHWGPTLPEKGQPEISRHFEIHTLEWFSTNRPCQEGVPHRLDGFEIIWVRKGAGWLSVDCHTYELSENVIYCLAPGQLRHFQAHPNLEGYYISLSAEFLYLADSHTIFSLWAGQFSSRRQLAIIRPDKEMQYEMEETLVKLRKEFANYFLLRAEILQGLLKILLIYLSRKWAVTDDERVQDKHSELVGQFLALLKQHFPTKKMVADYAGELCVTPSYLNQIVKKVTGSSASHHIQQYVVLEAKRQAIYSTLSMKEIAAVLGFDDYAHFSKYFKKVSGMNFTSFKKGYPQNSLQK